MCFYRQMKVSNGAFGLNGGTTRIARVCFAAAQNDRFPFRELQPNVHFALTPVICYCLADRFRHVQGRNRVLRCSNAGSSPHLA